jgi:hypothetical protein
MIAEEETGNYKIITGYLVTLRFAQMWRSRKVLRFFDEDYEECLFGS